MRTLLTLLLILAMVGGLVASLVWENDAHPCSCFSSPVERVNLEISQVTSEGVRDTAQEELYRGRSASIRVAGFSLPGADVLLEINGQETTFHVQQ